MHGPAMLKYLSVSISRFNPLSRWHSTISHAPTATGMAHPQSLSHRSPYPPATYATAQSPVLMDGLRPSNPTPRNKPLPKTQALCAEQRITPDIIRQHSPLLRKLLLHARYEDPKAHYPNSSQPPAIKPLPTKLQPILLFSSACRPNSH